MAYMPELHYCCVCRVYLGMDDGDGICSGCEDEMIECPKCGEFHMPEHDCCPEIKVAEAQTLPAP